jgi:hypothetical protein
MLEGDPIALFISVVVIPAALLVTIFGRSIENRILALSLAVLVTGKLWRVRGVVDVHIEPWLADHFGVHNLPVLFAALVVVAGYCGVAFAIAPRPTFWRWILPLAVVLSAITLLAYRSAYGEAFSPYLSEGGLDTTTQALAWTLPLLVVTAASIAIIPPAIEAYRQAHDNTPARVSALGVGALGILGIGYVVAKGGYLIIATIDDEAGVLPLLATAGLVTLPLAFLSLGIAVFTPPTMRLWGRNRRFVNLLRVRQDPAAGPHLPQQSTTELWRLADRPVDAHMAVVNAVDAVILDDEPPPAT